MKTVLIASNNNHKFEEISAILAHLPIRLIKPSELGLSLDVAETGQNYYQNALLKAEAFYQASGLPVLSDDSGLEVEALGGEPGLHSHRYSPNQVRPIRTDASICCRNSLERQNPGWQTFIAMQFSMSALTWWATAMAWLMER